MFTGILIIAGVLPNGELASLMPRAGGMYIYIGEAFSPLRGFLYGWTLFAVIQTESIAAVAVAFARFSAMLWPLALAHIFSRTQPGDPHSWIQDIGTFLQT